MYSHSVLVHCPLVSHFMNGKPFTKLGLHPLIPPLNFADGAAKYFYDCTNAVLQFNHRDNTHEDKK